MTSPIRRDEDPQIILKEALELLAAFATTPSPYAISNQSLLDLVTEFRARLERAAKEGQAVALIRQWRSGLSAAKADVLKSARLMRLADGRTLPLLGESEAARIASICPDRPRF